MSASVLVQLIITLGAIAIGFLGFVSGRRTRHVTAEVTLSVEAREWAKAFEDRARNAESRAERAEARADRAERAADAAIARAEECAARVDAVERHVARLNAIMIDHGLEPPSRPPVARRRSEDA